jgi:hypothetical protein
MLPTVGPELMQCHGRKETPTVPLVLNSGSGRDTSKVTDPCTIKDLPLFTNAVCRSPQRTGGDCNTFSAWGRDGPHSHLPQGPPSMVSFFS